MAQRIETLPEEAATEIKSTVNRLMAIEETLRGQCRIAASLLHLPKANWMPTPDCSSLVADVPDSPGGEK